MYHEALGKENHPDWQNGEFGMFKLIQKTLPSHIGIFNPNLEDFWGLAMFVKNDINIKTEGVLAVHTATGSLEEQRNGHTSKNIQYVTLEVDGKMVSVINFHGLWNGKGKTDTQERIVQSQNILDFLQELSGEYILCGDFNLTPDTKSLLMFEEFGMQNLIKDYGVSSTRTSFYTKPGKFADYMFITPGLEVKDFEVLPEEVSDHAALYLEV